MPRSRAKSSAGGVASAVAGVPPGVPPPRDDSRVVLTGEPAPAPPCLPVRQMATAHRRIVAVCPPLLICCLLSPARLLEVVGLTLIVVEASRARAAEFDERGLFRRIYDWF